MVRAAVGAAAAVRLALAPALLAAGCGTNEPDRITSSADGAAEAGSQLARLSADDAAVDGSSTSPPCDATCMPSAPSCGGVITDAGRCLVALASGQTRPYSVAVDGTYLYFTEYVADDPDAGTVKKVLLGGGPVVALAVGQDSAHTVVVDSANVYWTNFTSPMGAVSKMPLDGGPIVLLASNQDLAHGLAIDDASVYWSDEAAGTIMKTPIAGGALTTLASGPALASPMEIALGDGVVYWTNWVSAQGTVLDVPASADGGSPGTLAAGMDWPYGIASDDANVYVTYSTSPGTVVKIPKNGDPAAILASSLDAPFGIRVDGQSVYWVNYGDGTVMKVALDGGTPTVLASGQEGPYHLAIDATSVYWANFDGDTVMKLTPK